MRINLYADTLRDTFSNVQYDGMQIFGVTYEGASKTALSNEGNYFVTIF
jgi:hypothetical protein